MYALTFMAGLINALSIMQFATTVSHVTGLVSNTAISIFSHNTENLIWLLSVILSFLAGSVISGFITGERSFKLDACYGYIIIAIGVMLFAGVHVLDHDGKGIIRLFALLMGLQNGMVVSFRGIVVRMTHMSGNLTDLGVHLGYMLRGKVSENILPAAIPGIGLLVFTVGGVLGLALFEILDFTAYDIVSVIYAVLGIVYLVFRKNHAK